MGISQGGSMEEKVIMNLSTYNAMVQEKQAILASNKETIDMYEKRLQELCNMFIVSESYNGHIRLDIELKALVIYLTHKIDDLGYSCDRDVLSEKVIHEYDLIPVTKNDTDQSE
jgi:predicted component of type VI protein secretion system